MTATLESGQNHLNLPVGKLRPGEGQTLPRVSAWAWEEEEAGKSSAPDPLPSPVEKACPSGKETHVVDENLAFYEEWELEACVDGALLAEQMDRVNAIPFTYQQLDIFKHKLDEVVHDLGSHLPAGPQLSPAT